MAGKVKLTEAQATALARLVRVFSPRAIHRKEAKRRGLINEFNICRRAKLIQSAGYECSVMGDDWLDTPEATALLSSSGKTGE